MNSLGITFVAQHETRRRKWMGDNVVRCDRSGLWGNRFKVMPIPAEPGRFHVVELEGERGGTRQNRNAIKRYIDTIGDKRQALARAVRLHREHFLSPEGRTHRKLARAELRGKDLACWCGLCRKHQKGRPFNEACADCPPCHCDTLGEWANARLLSTRQARG